MGMHNDMVELVSLFPCLFSGPRILSPSVPQDFWCSAFTQKLLGRCVVGKVIWGFELSEVKCVKE